MQDTSIFEKNQNSGRVDHMHRWANYTTAGCDAGQQFDDERRSSCSLLICCDLTFSTVSRRRGWGKSLFVVTQKMDCCESLSCWPIFLQNIDLVTRVWGVFTSIGKRNTWASSYLFSHLKNLSQIANVQWSSTPFFVLLFFPDIWEKRDELEKCYDIVDEKTWSASNWAYGQKSLAFFLSFWDLISGFLNSQQFWK